MLADFAKRVEEAILAGKIKNRRELNRFKNALARELGLKKVPKNNELLPYVQAKENEKIIELLVKKPSRSASGINVIAIMPKAFECPGRCIYCPSSQISEETPKSYTGKEPAAMRALQAGYDPKKQVLDRIRQLTEAGHSATKIELIIMGGTFLAMPEAYREWFVKEAIDAVTGRRSKNLEEAKRLAETSQRRIIGITFETRPDFCREQHVNAMLNYAGTRCELGVQILNDEIYAKIKRGHSVEDVAKATRLLKDAGFKVCYHIMPGLPFASEQDDLASFKLMFEDERFKPDMLKFYPCLVLKGTELYEMYKRKEYKPLSTEQAVERIAKMKKLIPYWVRVMRVQRDIPAQLIEAGVKKSNLRQLVRQYMQAKGWHCKCIRCREAGHTLTLEQIKEKINEAELFIEEYDASKGKEIFLSFETPDRKHLFAYCRLRIPEHSFRKEIADKNAIIRELRVLGLPLPLHEKEEYALQHRGLGAELLSEAEKLAKEVYDKQGMVIISGIGVKQYYREKFGYKNLGPYVYKELR